MRMFRWRILAIVMFALLAVVALSFPIGAQQIDGLTISVEGSDGPFTEGQPVETVISYSVDRTLHTGTIQITYDVNQGLSLVNYTPEGANLVSLDQSPANMTWVVEPDNLTEEVVRGSIRVASTATEPGPAITTATIIVLPLDSDAVSSRYLWNSSSAVLTQTAEAIEAAGVEATGTAVAGATQTAEADDVILTTTAMASDTVATNEAATAVAQEGTETAEAMVATNQASTALAEEGTATAEAMVATNQAAAALTEEGTVTAEAMAAKNEAATASAVETMTAATATAIAMTANPYPGPAGFLMNLGLPGALILAGLCILGLLLLWGVIRMFRKRSAPAATVIVPPGGAAAPTAYLKTLEDGRVFPIAQTPFTIGRAEDSSLVINESFEQWQTISRDHAEISIHQMGYVIEDLGSRNGIKVQGRPVLKNLLKNEWRVDIGGVGFSFYIDEDAGEQS